MRRFYRCIRGANVSRRKICDPPPFADPPDRSAAYSIPLGAQERWPESSQQPAALCFVDNRICHLYEPVRTQTVLAFGSMGKKAFPIYEKCRF